MIDRKTKYLIFDLILYLLILVAIFFLPALEINNKILTIWSLPGLNISNYSIILVLSLIAFSTLGIIIVALYFATENIFLDYVDAGFRVMGFISTCILFMILPLNNYPEIKQLMPAPLLIIFSLAFLMISKGMSGLHAPKKTHNTKPFNIKVWIRTIIGGILFVGFVTGRYLGLIIAIIVLIIFELIWTKFKKTK